MQPARSARSRAARRRQRPVLGAVEPLEPRLALTALGFASELGGKDALTLAAPGGGVVWRAPAAAAASLPAAAYFRAASLEGFTAPQVDAATTWLVLVMPGTDPAAAAAAAGAIDSQPTPLLANTHIWTFPEGSGGAGRRLLSATDSPPAVAAAYPLIAREHVKRLIPNDPLFPSQWHLQNTGQGGGTPGEDARVTGVWNEYRGTGVLIGIVDDGLEYTHPDLSARYVAAASFDFNGNDPNPMPVLADDDHGTAVAGVAAAAGNNSLGVSGAAPGASLAGLRLTSGPTTDAQEAAALTFALADIDIYNNSWGPPDNGRIGAISTPGPLTLAALERGVTQGRDGLGAIYVWSAGNGLQANDNVNYDGYANSRYTIAVTAIDNFGRQAPYAEPGAPILVAAHSNGGSRAITTTDLAGPAGDNPLTSAAGGDYRTTFGGTSSSAPLVSGVVALMLEANPDLGWRDVQHVLVNSARRNDPSDADWRQNGSGRWVNHKYGYGAVDAAAAVALAETWTAVAAETTAGSGTQTVGRTIPDNNATGISSSFTMSADLTTEWVEVTFAAAHSYRGDLEVVLTSPAGTRSVLAERRINDPGDNYSNWTFTSARHWGESAAGTWTLTVRDRAAQDVGTWNSWSLDVYGTSGAPVDTIPPTVAIARAGSGTIGSGGSALVTFTLSEPATNFAVGDVAVTGGSLAGFTGSGTSYTATFTPTAGFTGSAEIAVAAGAFTDAAGNPNLAGGPLVIPVDTVGPTVTITRAGTGTLIGGAGDTLTFTLSVATTQFTAADITVAGGAILGFSGSGTVYTATFTPAAAFQGSATVSVAAGAFTNGGGNPNALTTLAIPVDAVPPTLTITRSGSGPLTVGSTATITFTVSEPVTTFGREDVTVSGGTLSPLSGSGAVYTATFEPTPGFTGTASISVAAGVFTDPASYPNRAASLTITIDAVAPTVTVSRTGSGELMVGGTAVITFQLSEPAADFGLASVAIAGGTLTNLQLVGTQATATFVPAAQFRGTATIAVPAKRFTDLAGNGNLASNTVSLPVNTVAPLITEFRASPTIARLRAGDSVVLEAGFSEPVTPVGGSFTVVLDSGGRAVLAVDPSGLTARGAYTVQFGEESPDLDIVGVVMTQSLGNAFGNPLDPSLPPAAAGLAARHAIIVDAAVKFVTQGVFSTDPGMVPDAGSRYRQVPIRFSTPVTGVSLAAFALSLDGRPLSLAGAVLTGQADAYELLLPLSRTSPVGIYTLSIRPGSGIRAVANGAEVNSLTALRWGHQRSVAMAPAAPPALTAVEVIRSELRTSVVLGWSVPAGNGGGEVTGYEVAYRQLGTSQWYDLRDPVAVTATPRATISGVAVGGQYEFRVAARNAAGLGEFVVLTPFTVQVAAPLLSPIERAGNVTLATDGDGNLRANGALITFNGGPANYGQLVAAGWTPVAAEVDNGVNTVILRHTSGHLHFWRMNAGWQQVSGDGWLAPGSSPFSDTELAFGVDLDGDGATGPILTPIEQAGSVTLATDGGGNLRANGTLITFNGGPANYGQLVAAGWTPVAAEVDNGVNTVILRHTSGHIHFWRMDAGWQQVSGDGWLAPGSPRFSDTETAFGVDLDGDRVIGLRLNLLKQAGGVALATDGGGNLRANSTLIRFNGGPVNHQHVIAAGWTPLAAGVHNGVNTVILRHTSGYLHFWRLDAGWQQVSGDGWVAPGSPQFFATELAFGVDLDGNLRVGS
jgi:subtilisin-like proprotein convertase family protein